MNGRHHGKISVSFFFKVPFHLLKLLFIGQIAFVSGHNHRAFHQFGIVLSQFPVDGFKVLDGIPSFAAGYVNHMH